MASRSNYRNKLLAGLLLGGGILLLLAGIAFAWVNHQTNPVATPTPASVEQVQRVSLVEAKSAFDAGTALFLDVRDPNSYAQSHIQGAISIPLDELSSRLNELDPGRWIITYCT